MCMVESLHEAFICSSQSRKVTSWSAAITGVSACYRYLPNCSSVFFSPVLFQPIETTANHTKWALCTNSSLQTTRPLSESLLRRSEEFCNNQHLFITFIDPKATFKTEGLTSFSNVLKYCGMPPKITIAGSGKAAWCS